MMKKELSLPSSGHRCIPGAPSSCLPSSFPDGLRFPLLKNISYFSSFLLKIHLNHTPHNASKAAVTVTGRQIRKALITRTSASPPDGAENNQIHIFYHFHQALYGHRYWRIQAFLSHGVKLYFQVLQSPLKYSVRFLQKHNVQQLWQPRLHNHYYDILQLYHSQFQLPGSVPAYYGCIHVQCIVAILCHCPPDISITSKSRPTNVFKSLLI